jgi:hypothetical protein
MAATNGNVLNASFQVIVFAMKFGHVLSHMAVFRRPV